MLTAALTAHPPQLLEHFVQTLSLDELHGVVVNRGPDAAESPRPRFRPRFRPDIQGLRGIAVLLVVLCHAVMGVRGGFIGVDVFFVVSGFLITGLLWREASGTGTIHLAQFYAGRARRLLPAAALVLVTTSVGAAVLLDNGKTVIGANVENASYGLTCCAERVALFAARTQYPSARVVALAVSAGPDSFVHETENTRMPCGASSIARCWVSECRPALAIE